MRCDGKLRFISGCFWVRRQSGKRATGILEKSPQISLTIREECLTFWESRELQLASTGLINSFNACTHGNLINA